VLPPYSTVVGPGVGMEPRTPQNLTTVFIVSYGKFSRSLEHILGETKSVIALKAFSALPYPNP
jgi:hypothetical protein